MNGEVGTSIEDIVRRNIAGLRAKASLTQQALADEMLRRGVAWTRETVAQVETTNRRIGLAEAIAVAACLDVPLARLTSCSDHGVSFVDEKNNRGRRGLNFFNQSLKPVFKLSPNSCASLQ